MRAGRAPKARLMASRLYRMVAFPRSTTSLQSVDRRPQRSVPCSFTTTAPKIFWWPPPPIWKLTPRPVTRMVPPLPPEVAADGQARPLQDQDPSALEVPRDLQGARGVGVGGVFGRGLGDALDGEDPGVGRGPPGLVLRVRGGGRPAPAAVAGGVGGRG